MTLIFKTWQKATYLKGTFQLRDNTNINWAHPIDFPTVFIAYGQAIKNGNWQSCTSINTPEYVIKNYFDTIGNSQNDTMFQMWQYCKQLETLTWQEVTENKDKVLNIINLANNELLKLNTIN